MIVKFFGTILCTQVPKLINWTLLENNENCLPLRAYLAKTCAISFPSLLTLLPHPNFFRKILTSSTIWPMSLLDSKWCWTICSVLPVYSRRTPMSFFNPFIVLQSILRVAFTWKNLVFLWLCWSHDSHLFLLQHSLLLIQQLVQFHYGALPFF